ncbi:diguanylate cyclase [Guptibacillus algicola]|uniref:diguanylate cyclase n=1 Tax=Guptibacillus algicola TaxID=225844 RepID=UPI001CD6EB4A|nr:diguanylate cyclase [Alkalihalobacillus algicola]MCA0988734.1 diguanylate cyclase [Alkalihalobacillus algicola]
MQLIQDYFSNMMMMLALLFIYYQHYKDENLVDTSSIKRKLTSGFFAGLAGSLLMFFGIEIGTSTIIDMRHVPFLLVTLYGGFLPGAVALIVIQLVRFAIGVSISSFASLVLLITLFIGYLLFRRWQVGTMLKVFLMLIYSNITFTVVITLMLDIESFYKINLLFWITSLASGMMAIYTSEYLRRINHLFKQYQLSSTIDPLTGLNNVRSFDEAMNIAIRESNIKRKPLSLLIIDIDYFKQVNDTYGHTAGDAVLQQFGTALRKSVGPEDIVSRNGGEEFTILLKNTSHDEALTTAEYVRSFIEEQLFKASHMETLHITASLGVATYPETVFSSDELYSKADQALYTAKRKGRNRVCSTNELSELVTQ